MDRIRRMGKKPQAKRHLVQNAARLRGVSQLEHAKEEIRRLLEFLERSYHRGAISEGRYSQLRAQSEEKLKTIDNTIEEMLQQKHESRVMKRLAVIDDALKTTRLFHTPAPAPAVASYVPPQQPAYPIPTRHAPVPVETQETGGDAMAELNRLQRQVETDRKRARVRLDLPSRKEIASLVKIKEDIESLLAFLEESHVEGSISDKSYNELRDENLRKLAQVTTQLKRKKSLLGMHMGADAEQEDYEAGPENGSSEEEGTEAGGEALEEDSGPQADDASTQETTGAPDPADGQQVPMQAAEPAGRPSLNGVFSFIKNIRETITKDRHGGGQTQGMATAGQQAGAPPADAGTAPSIAPPATASSGTAVDDDGFAKMPTPEEIAARSGGSMGEQSSVIMQSGTGGAGMGGGGSDALAVELEKMKVKVDSASETRNVMEDRLERVMESLGELRSMVFQRESAMKELEAKLDRYNEMLGELEPQKFQKELQKRDKMLGEAGIRLEKLEVSTQEMSKGVGTIHNTLESIGSLKNIAGISKEINEKTAKADATMNRAQRMSDDVGKMYIELNRRLSEFTVYKTKQDALEESLKELLGAVEALNAKLASYADRGDLESVKNELESVKRRASEAPAKPAAAPRAEEATAPAEEETESDVPKSPRVAELERRKDGIEALLESTEEGFKAGAIPKGDYKKIISTNRRKIDEINAIIQKELGGAGKGKAGGKPGGKAAAKAGSKAGRKETIADKIRNAARKAAIATSKARPKPKGRKRR